MSESYALPVMLADLMLRECTEPLEGEAKKVVTVNLTAAHGVSRARGSAVYGVSLSLSWGDDEFVLIDARGYRVRWKFATVVKWLEKSLSATSHELVINMDDARNLPARWTDKREKALVEKMAALSANAMRQEASAKRDSVLAWGNGERRSAVLAAAEAMDKCADLLEEINPGGGDDGGDDAGGGGDGGGDGVAGETGHDLQSAAMMVADSVVTGKIIDGAVKDWWAIEFERGMYELDLQGAGVGAMGGPAAVTLYDAAGQPVRVNDVPILYGMGGVNWLNQEIDFEVEIAGRYYLEVGGETGYGVSVGGYSLAFRKSGVN